MNYFQFWCVYRCMKPLFLSLFVILLSGCAVFGESNVEVAPYDVIERVEAQNIEVRNYPRMVLVSTAMDGDRRNGAFRRLFNYISGDNVSSEKVAMTAPVFMDQGAEEGVEIPMTAPVFMDDEGAQRMMSFVMPADFTIETTPVPTDPEVKVSELKDYQVAAIIFNGRLSEANIDEHRTILESWIADSNYAVNGPVQSAGYNAPFTLPQMRRNEVLIPVEKKN